MACHGLDGVDVGLVSIVTESKLVSHCLGGIIELGSCSVGIDVENILLLVEAGLGEGEFDALGLGGSVRPRGCGVVCVAGIAVAHHFAVNLCSAGLCVLIFLEDNHSGSVSHHESAPVGIERQGCVLRVLGAGKSLGIGEACKSERNRGILGTTCNDGIGIAVLDGPVGLSDIVCRCRTGGNHVDCRAIGVMLDGDVACSDVGNHRRDEERRYPFA